MWHHIDALMHLCFLGIAKSVVRLIGSFLNRRSRLQSFLLAVQGRLEQINRPQLQWCKAIPCKKGKLGGWVSENYVAIGKVVKWFCSDLVDIAETVEFVEPDAPLEQWLVRDLKGWLRVRGLAMTGNEEELFERVSSLLRDGPPPLLKDIGMDEEDAARLAVALSALLARAMVTSVKPGETARDLNVSVKVS